MKKHIKNKLVYLILAPLLISCASRKIMEYEKIKDFQMNKEYEEMVKVEKAPEPPPEKPIEKPEEGKEGQKTGEGKIEETKKELPRISKVPVKKPIKEVKKPVEVKKGVKVTKIPPRQPVIEDSEGFEGRRPIVDPFIVGEEVEMAVTYFNMAAGYLKFKVHPYATVNGKKSYDFEITVKSSKVFSYFYAVDDTARTFVDYESLIPSTYTIDVKESKQLKDIRSFFDFSKNKGVYWEKKIKKGSDEESKKKEWDILPYSQNVISAFYYLRTFQLKPGKKLNFRVADAGKNLVFKGEVLRKEKLQTEIGELDTVVIKPEFEIDGVFKPMGDIFVWLTDDENKFPVRIDAKIKIGTLILKVKSINK